MQISPATCQLRLEWTLPICVRKLEPIIGWQNVYVHDLDAKLTISYWEVEDRQHEWEITHAEIDGVIVTKDTDPAIWELVKRAYSRDFDAMNESILDRIADYAEAA